MWHARVPVDRYHVRRDTSVPRDTSWNERHRRMKATVKQVGRVSPDAPAAFYLFSLAKHYFFSWCRSIGKAGRWTSSAPKKLSSSLWLSSLAYSSTR